MGPLELFGVVAAVLSVSGLNAKDLVAWIKRNSKEPFSVAFKKTVKEFKGKFPHIEEQLALFLGTESEKNTLGLAALDPVDWEPLITALANRIDPLFAKHMPVRLDVKGILTYFSNALDEAYLNSDQRTWYADRKRRSSDERLSRLLQEQGRDTRELLSVVHQSQAVLNKLASDKVSVLGEVWRKRIEKCRATEKDRGLAHALPYWEALVDEIEEEDAKDPDLLFEVYTNLASCYWGLGARDKAKPLLIQAYEVKPGEKRAKLNRGLAYMLDGKIALAHETVDDVIKVNPNDPKALAVKASLLVSEGRFPDVIDLFQPYFDQQAGKLTVESADCYRSFGYSLSELGDMATAVKVLKHAVADALDDPGLKALLAVALASLIPRRVGLTEEGRTVLTSAEGLFSEAIDLYRGQGLLIDLGQTLSNRAGVRIRLSRFDDAFQDAREAYQYVPEGLVRRNYFIACMLRGRHSDADDVLKSWEADPAFGDKSEMAPLALQFLLAVEDKKALERSRKIIADGWPDDGLADLPVDVLESYADLLVDHGELDEAQDIGSILQRTGQKARGLTIYGRISYKRNNESLAVSTLVQAREAAEANNDEEVLVLVARYLSAWKAWAEAVETFKLFEVTPWSPRSIILHFLLSMYHANVVAHEDAILALAEGYRLNRGLDLGIIQVEIAVLENRGHFGKVVTLLNQLLRQYPDRQSVRLEHALALFRSGETGQSSTVAQGLKADEEFSPIDYLRAAALLTRLNEPHRSLEFSYQGWRRGRKKPEINLGFVQAFLSATQGNELNLDTHQVEPGTAVTVAFDGDVDETYLIAMGTESELLDQEIPLADEISGKLMGHRTGESIEWKQTVDGISSVIIKAIRHRFVWAFQTALTAHAKRFPGDSSLQEFNVEDDLASVFRLLDRHEAMISEAIGQYQTTPLPFGALSHWTGRSVYETWTGTLAGGRFGLFASSSTQDEAKREQPAVNTKSIVADPLFLFTQQYLGRLGQLTDRFDRILVPQQVVDAVRRSLEEVERFTEGQLRVGKAADGTYFKQEINREQIDFAKAFLSSVIDFCETKCERAGRERQYTKFEASFAEFVGEEFMVPITVAQSAGVILASDDARLRQFAFQEYGVHGVSSVTLMNHESNDESHAVVMVKLLQGHYCNVPISIRALTTVAKKRLTPHAEDMKLLLDRLFSESVSEQSILYVSSGFMSQLLLSINYFGAIELFLEDILSRVLERLGNLGYQKFRSVVTKQHLLEISTITRARKFIDRWEASRRWPSGRH